MTGGKRYVIRRARFVVRRHPIGDGYRAPWVLKDREHPAFVGQYRTHGAAIAAACARALTS